MNPGILVRTVPANTSLEGSRLCTKSICRLVVRGESGYNCGAWSPATNQPITCRRSAMAISEFDTVLPADSVEFCTTPGFHDIFVCGTYHLLTDQPTTQVDEGCSKAQQKRRGQCLVFRVIHGGDDDMKNMCVRVSVYSLI